MKTFDVYVVFRYFDGDFQDIYLTKDEADKACIERNKKLYDQYNKPWCKLSLESFFLMKGIIYKVITLYEALEDVKEFTQLKLKDQITEDELNHEEYPE